MAFTVISGGANGVDLEAETLDDAISSHNLHIVADSASLDVNF